MGKVSFVVETFGESLLLLLLKGRDGMTLLKKMTAVAMINEKASNSSSSSSSSSTEVTPKAAKWNEGFEKKLLLKIRLY